MKKLDDYLNGCANEVYNVTNKSLSERWAADKLTGNAHHMACNIREAALVRFNERLKGCAVLTPDQVEKIKAIAADHASMAEEILLPGSVAAIKSDQLTQLLRLLQEAL